MYGAVTRYRPASQPVPLYEDVTTTQSYNPDHAVTWTVWASPRSLATTCGITLVFSSYAYLDVSVQRVRLPLCGMACLQHAGLPHSEIRGSIRMCRSPRLIAACRVLLRLWEPRHPPCALIYFLPSRGPFACRGTASAVTRDMIAGNCFLCPLFCISLFYPNMSKNVL